MTLEQRLERLETRAAIADLVHGYALAIRHDRPQDVERLFARDGTFEIRDGTFEIRESGAQARSVQRFESPQALVTYLLPRKGGHPIPIIHNLMIEIEGDTARASSVMVGPILGTAHETFGEYADSFVREDGEWKFASRIFTIFRPPTD